MSAASSSQPTAERSTDETQATGEPRPLSQRLKEVSFKGHGMGEPAPAEEPKFATAYLRGGLNRDGIAAQAAQHFLMYEAIEAATHAHHERLGVDFAFWMPELHRLPSLRLDLEELLGPEWEQQVRSRFATPGIMAYVDRINEVSAKLPLYVAHHYTRYLADLSGGQMIAKMFRKSYGVVGDEGMHFYVFDEIADPWAFKDRYREVVDASGFSAEEEEALLAEVELAYALNNRAAEDLEARFEEYLA